jgi:hypothetical protein
VIFAKKSYREPTTDNQQPTTDNHHPSVRVIFAKKSYREPTTDNKKTPNTHPVVKQNKSNTTILHHTNLK